MDTAIEAVNLGTHAHDMSLWGLFMMADLVVKSVMIMLVIASVWSWTIMFSKRSKIIKLNKKADIFEDSFWSGETLDKIYAKVKNSKPDPMLKTFSAGMEEWKRGIEDGLPSRTELQAGLRQRIDRAMHTSIMREMNTLERGMTFLASVGSTAPFIGLFGTVWGIMNSFSAIAASNNTSLAVVAPGIAEALFATALGLVAAIPATLAYNVFSTQLDRYAGRLEGFAGEFHAILSRHLDAERNKDDKATPGPKKVA